MNVLIKNAESKILAMLNRSYSKNYKLLSSLYQGEFLQELATYCANNAFEKIEDIYSMFIALGYPEQIAWYLSDELVNYVYDLLEEQAKRKTAQKLLRARNKTANRARYTRELVFTWYEHTPGKWRWRFVRNALRSFGLLSHIVEQQGGEPVAMGLLYAPPQNVEDVDEIAANREQYVDELDNMIKADIAVSGERLGWYRKSKAWDILRKSFPKAIDMAAYNHGLNAPLLPHGYMPDVGVVFKVLTDANGVDLNTDGSGIYHPQTPEMQPLIAKYGLVAFQLRAINPTNGIFAKGIMFPSELSVHEGKPVICLDWRQLKGQHKALAKQRRVEKAVKTSLGMHVGILQCWEKPGKISGGFELLENIATNDRTKAIVDARIDAFMDKLAARGIDGLLALAAKRSPQVAFMMQLIAAGLEAGVEIHAAQVPQIRAHIASLLGRRLWKSWQGAALKLNSYVCRIDDRIPAGACVLSDLPAGVPVVGFRYPLILPQGLLELETIDPLEDHLVGTSHVEVLETYEEVFDEVTQTWVRV